MAYSKLQDFKNYVNDLDTSYHDHANSDIYIRNNYVIDPLVINQKVQNKVPV